MVYRAMGCTGLYWALLAFSVMSWALLDYNGPYWALLGCIGLHRAVLGCILLYWAILDFTRRAGIHWTVLDSWLH